MSEIINLYEAKTNLSKLVDRAAKGEEIIIAKGGKPMAALTPLSSAQAPKRKPGLLRDKIWIAEDFDAPLPEELLQAFEGEA